jgi:hypothetical protein
MSKIQRDVSPHLLKIGHIFIRTYLLGIVHTIHLLKYLLFLLKHPVYSVTGTRGLYHAVCILQLNLILHLINRPQRCTVNSKGKPPSQVNRYVVHGPIQIHASFNFLVVTFILSGRKIMYNLETGRDCLLNIFALTLHNHPSNLNAIYSLRSCNSIIKSMQIQSLVHTPDFYFNIHFSRKVLL